jgi:Fe-Mn family superoxide dismutase
MSETIENRPFSRRGFLIGVAAAGAAAAVSGFTPFVKPAMAAPIELPPLPYPDDALAPVISSNTIGFHYGKHHRGYLDKLNELIQGTPMADMRLEEIVRAVAVDPEKKAVFNNAAQTWNHTFYWRSMRPKGGGKPSGELAAKIDASFGSFDEFRKQFVDAGLTQFGSGWAWLVSDKGSLKVIKTPNADTPVTTAAVPLLAIDVWEHAYYLDYQNRRKDYVTAVLDNLINWDFAEENLARS